MKLIQKRKRVQVESFGVEYAYWDCHGGFIFDSDKRGVIDRDKLPPAALANLLECEAGTNGTRCVGIVDRSYSYLQPAVGICEVCGAHVSLDHYISDCGCGADYNMEGQRMAPREFWGDDTGESLDEILSPPF